MPSTSEAILGALAAVLAPAMPQGVTFERNATELFGDLPLVVLQDGDPGEPDVLLSPASYIYAHRAELDVIVDGAEAENRDPAFDAIKLAVGIALAADRTLGGLCDWIEAEAPAPLDIAAEGALGVKAATIGIVLHYASPDPLG